MAKMLRTFILLTLFIALSLQTAWSFNSSNPRKREEPCIFSRYRSVNLGPINGYMADFPPKPAYPSYARRRRIEGTVTVKLLINVHNGRVVKVCIIEGDRNLAKAAMNAALRCRFSVSRFNRIIKAGYNYAHGVINYQFNL
jgi:TonB family protein